MYLGDIALNNDNKIESSGLREGALVLRFRAKRYAYREVSSRTTSSRFFPLSKTRKLYVAKKYIEDVVYKKPHNET